MYDPEYVAAVRNALLAVCESIAAANKVDRVRDYEEFLTWAENYIKRRQTAANLIGPRLVEIARKRGMPDPAAWGVPLRTLLACDDRGEPPLQVKLVVDWLKRLQDLAIFLLYGPVSATTDLAQPATIAIPPTEGSGDTETAILNRELAAVIRGLSSVAPDRPGEIVDQPTTSWAPARDDATEEELCNDPTASERSAGNHTAGGGSNPLIGPVGAGTAATTPGRSFTSPAPPPEGGWTTAGSPSRWAKLFGLSDDTFKRLCRKGKIRHQKLSSKSYQVAINDLPAMHQAKFRAAGPPPTK